MDNRQIREPIVFTNGDILKNEDISPELRIYYDMIAKDVYDKLENVLCRLHPTSMKSIVVSAKDEEIEVSIYTCCWYFAQDLHKLFEKHPYPVTVVFLRSIDPREQN